MAALDHVLSLQPPARGDVNDAERGDAELLERGLSALATETASTYETVRGVSS